MIEKAKQTLREALRQGAREAEVYISRGRELAIEVQDGRVETLRETDVSGVAVRAFRGTGVGVSYTTELDPARLGDTARQAVENASLARGDEFSGVCGPPGEPYPAVPVDESIGTVSLEEKIGMARQAEIEARAVDPRIGIVEVSGYEDQIREEIILNSRGVEVSGRSAYCGLYVSLAARDGDQVETGFAVDYRRRISQLDPPDCARRAARQAVSLLGAGSMETTRVPLVFDPYTAASLLGVLAPSFSGENVLKGKSMLAQKLHQEVMSPGVTILDDGVLPDGVLSAPCDAEGVPCRRNVLVSGGTVERFLHNTYTGRRSRQGSTGNASRSGLGGPVGVSTTNFYLVPGSVPAADLEGGVARGLAVTGLMGVHTADPISGDFSFGASGFLLEKGKRTRPVRGIVIAGNILDLFRDLRGIADDLTFFVGRGAPSILTEKMTVSGK